ncbi:MAG: sulfite exporter TauE/SafE family protein [Lautropia sp.]|nr:sulfite exporter TauE/SafE family protein [Lautropia sp.]
MTTAILLSLLALGAGAGFMAGLFGVGGGMVMVPFLTMVFAARGIPPELIVQMSLATALATIMFTSLSSLRAHHKAGAVLWPVVWMLVPGILLGGQLGARIVTYLPGRLLAGLFAVFVGWTAWKMLRSARQGGAGLAGTPLPGRLGLAGTGVGIGILSALFGAGGGFITVPYLASHQVPFPKAIATSAACGFPIALSGTLGYLLVGWWLQLPGGALAYIDLGVLLAIVPMSMLFAPLGARAAHRLPVARLKRLFAGLLFCLAVYMLLARAI